MTYSAPRQRIIASPSTLLTAEEPLDAFAARDVVTNNLLHHADQCGARVLVNFMSAPVSGKDVFIAGVDSDGKWAMVESFGPYPLSVMQVDGVLRAYPLRVELNAGSDDATSHTFLVEVSSVPWSRPVAAGDVTDGGNVCVFNATTSSSGWLTPSVDNLIHVQDIASFATTIPTLTEEGGDAVGVLCYLAWVRVRCLGSAPALYAQ